MTDASRPASQGITATSSGAALATPPVVRLSGSLTINEADERRLELLEAFRQQDHLTLDCRDLDKLDVTGVQLLLALRTSVMRSGKTLRLISAPASLLHLVLARAGLCRDQNDARANTADDAFCMTTE